jgi:hypothetical protein
MIRNAEKPHNFVLVVFSSIGLDSVGGHFQLLILPPRHPVGPK